MSSNPEQGSILAEAIMCKKLLTHPLQWTQDLHLPHLSFTLQPPLSLNCGIVSESDSRSLTKIQLTALLDSAAAVELPRSKIQRDKAMRRLVQGIFEAVPALSSQSPCLSFLYSRRPKATINLPICFYHQQSIPWAYIDESWCSEARKKYWKERKKTFTFGIHAVQEAQRSPIDPLYIAILIALAQWVSRRRIANPPHKVYLFVPKHTNDPENSRRYIKTLTKYTATVPDEYLQKFNDPSHFHDATLHIKQEVLGFDLLVGIFEKRYQAIEKMSAESCANSIVPKKRKAVEDNNDLQASRRTV